MNTEDKTMPPKKPDPLADQLAAVSAALDFAGIAGIPGDGTLVERIHRLHQEHMTALGKVRADTTANAILAEIEAALPPAADGERGLVQRVKGVVGRSSTAPGLSPRDRAILAPLLDTLDADLSSTDAGRALVAVRAVVGVGRG